MTLNTKQVLKNLKGEEITSGDEPFTLGTVIANVLSSVESGGKMKLYILAQKAHDQDSIELDAADVALIKNALETSKIYQNVVLGQALVMLEEAK